MSQRNSAKRKGELVLRVLRGETLEEVSRGEKVTIAELTEWREQFIQKGIDGFKKDPEKAEIGRYERTIGNLHMEIELLKKKNDFMEKYRGNSSKR